MIFQALLGSSPEGRWGKGELREVYPPQPAKISQQHFPRGDCASQELGERLFPGLVIGAVPLY